MTPHGNFNPDPRIVALEEAAGLKSVHGANIFFVPLGKPLPDGSDPILVQAKKKIFEVRSRRVRPLRDDKVLVSWNGLMIAAMSFAYQVLGEKKYLAAAQKSASFILSKMRGQDGKLKTRYRDGEARYSGYLDDYAFLIWGLLSLYESDFDKKWYEEVLSLQKIQDTNFWDELGGRYFFTDGSDPTVFVRNKESYDGAIPAGNSASALNLLKLSALRGDLSYQAKALRILKNTRDLLLQAPAGVSLLLQAVDFATDKSKELAFIGNIKDPEIASVLNELRSSFLPNKVVSLGVEGSLQPELLKDRKKLDGKSAIYVCEKGTCLLPVSQAEEAFKLIHTFSPFQV